MATIESAVSEYEGELQTFTEEILNTITHGTGFLLSIPAAIILVLLARRHGTIWHMFGCGVFGASIVVMYTCSTMYHYSGIGDIYITTKTLRDLDHCAVYFLIAGTYTPFALINMIYNNTYDCSHVRSGKTHPKVAGRIAFFEFGWVVLILVWVLCVFGVSTKLMFGTENIPPVIGYGCYLCMGWMGTVVSGPMFSLLPKTGLRLLVAGGLSYTIGVFFLLSDTLPFNHPVWHLFVGTGSILHYCSVIACAIPMGDHNYWKKMENRTQSQMLDRFSRFAYANLCRNI